jgi:proton-coupled amino acid transporter
MHDSTEDNLENIETTNNEVKVHSHSNIKHSLDKSNTFRNSLSKSIMRISSYYETNNRVLSSNFAGAEEDFEEKDENPFNPQTPFLDQPNMSTSLTRYEIASKKGELSFWATLFTFIKVNIVAGFLFLPSGFNNGGWLFSVIAIFIVSMITIYCNISISECTDKAKSFSFSRIGFKAAGNFGYYLVEFGIAISQICFPCSYVNLITQIVNNMLNLWLGQKDNPQNYFLYIAITIFCIVVPLCLIRNISKFASLHLIGDIAVLATIVTLAYESISSISQEPDFNFDNVKLFNVGWYKLLGMVITSLEGIGIILPIKESMKEKQKFKYIIIIGTFVISIVITGFPLIMYFCYQNQVNEIVLNNLPLDKVYIQVVLGLMMFSIIIIYPVTLFPAFIILENIFCNSGKGEKIKRLSNADNRENQEHSDHHNNISNIITKTPEGEVGIRKDPMSWRVIISENILRVMIVTLTVVVGVFSINRFDTLLALAGCAVCTPIALIFPSVFHFLLFKSSQSKFRNCVDLSIAFLGISLSLTVLTFTFL